MLRSECKSVIYRIGLIGLGILLLAVGTNGVLGQEPVSGKHSRTDEGGVFLSIDADLRALKEDPRTGLLPWEIYSAFFGKILGVDWLVEDSVQAEFAYRNDGLWIAAFVSSRSSLFQLEELSKRRFTPVKDANGAKREDVRRFSDSSIWVQKLGNVWYVGTEQALSVFAAAECLPIPTKQEANDTTPPMLSIALKPSPIREPLVSWMEQLVEDNEEPEYKAATHLIRSLKEARIEVFSGSLKSARVTLRASGDVTTQQLQEQIRTLQRPNLRRLQEFVQSKVDCFRLSQREQFAWESYVDRLRYELEEAIPKMDDREVVYEIETLLNVPLAALLGQSVLETLEYKRLSNERFSAQYKLRELNEAIEKYIKEKGSFPLREILSEEGESLLSWRVALLPYLGYESLYEKFRLNEPWNSSHNLALLDRMPSIYRNSNPEIATGYTTFVAPYGARDARRKTIWDIVPRGLQDISEEERESILLIEINAEAAVPWTSPEDIDVTQQDLRILLRDPPEGNGVVYINGNTDYLSNAVSTLSLIELLNCSTVQER